MEIALGAARHWMSVSVRGVTPSRKPRVTTPAARKTLREGTVRVTIEDTAMVSGRTRPRAIWTVRGYQTVISKEAVDRKNWTNLEERRLHTPQTEDVENQADNVDEGYGRELLCGFEVQLGYLDLLREEGRHMEQNHGQDQLIQEEQHGKLG